MLFFQPKNTDIFLFLHESIPCEYLLEGSASNEYPQGMFLWRNKKSLCGYALLSWAVSVNLHMLADIHDDM